MKRLLSNANDYTGMLIPPLSDTITRHTLAASTAETFTVPTGAKAVILTSLGATAYVRGSIGSPDEVAAVPSGDSDVGNTSAPLPDSVPRMFRCDDIATISVIAAAATTVIAEWLK